MRIIGRSSGTWPIDPNSPQITFSMNIPKYKTADQLLRTTLCKSLVSHSIRNWSMPSTRGQSRERTGGERTSSVHCCISAQRSQPNGRFPGRGRKLRWRRGNHRSGIRDLRARRPSRRTSRKTDGQNRARAHDNQKSVPLRFQTRPGLCVTARISRCSVKSVIVFE